MSVSGPEKLWGIRGALHLFLPQEYLPSTSSELTRWEYQNNTGKGKLLLRRADVLGGAQSRAGRCPLCAGVLAARRKDGQAWGVDRREGWWGALREDA